MQAACFVVCSLAVTRYGYHNMNRHSVTEITAGSVRAIYSRSATAAVTAEQLRDLSARLLDDPGPAVLKKGKYKTLFTADIAGSRCLVKRYVSRGITGIIRGMFSRSRALKEFAAARAIVERGIPIPDPVAAAEQRFPGAVHRSMVAYRFLEGTAELRAVFFDRASFSSAERREAATAFGGLTARIFSSGIYQYDYSLNNFLAGRREGGLQLWLIDFERVRMRDVPRSEKLELLARLNRVGREVSLAARMRFLRSFCEADDDFSGGHRHLFRELQELTLLSLQHDLERGRITSLYTHGRYDRLQHNGFSGLLRKDRDAEQLTAALERDSGKSLTGCEVFLFEGGDASRVWAILSAFIIAGLDLELPLALAEKDKRGAIVIENDDIVRYRAGLCAESRVLSMLRRHFPDELALVRAYFVRS